jgi:hypothetical protein
MSHDPFSATNPTGERRTGLICKSFSLELKQDWRQAGTGTLITDTFRLQATDTSNILYVLAPASVADEAALIALLLRRIATVQGQVGWKFDGMYYAAQRAGIIIG